MSSPNIGMSYSKDPPTNTNSNDAKKNEVSSFKKKIKKNEVSDQMKQMSYSNSPHKANSSPQKSQTLSTQDSMSYPNYK
ncbi:hypothetical protein MtrunA17_Chr2g0297671 [Medicago truncatula]|uniref:Uncharacterized protein n=1 Tax=Medicago truncatula TaxID=3880 RepID=A0A396JDY1_MEDTR|nr:hypothetical protein MtrunA17_Chr2g0297671 [Medicago truncatula]